MQSQLVVFRLVCLGKLALLQLKSLFTTAPEKALPVRHMDHSGMVPLLHHLGSAPVTSIAVAMFMQAVFHEWPCSFALAACTRLALNYMDDVSLTEEVLLEPANVALMVERGPVDSPSHQEGQDVGTDAGSPSYQQGTHGGAWGNQQQQGVHGGISQLQASALPLSLSKRQLGLPRPEPCSKGLCVRTRWGPFHTSAEKAFLDIQDCGDVKTCDNHSNHH